MTPSPLVDAGWLEARLGDPGVRVFDCAVTREARAEGPSLYRSERAAWEAKRIPGAGYLHMVEDLCDGEAEVPFTLASPERVAEAMAARGVRGDETIVLYGRGNEWAVHRVWWALRASGFGDVRALDGGLGRWEREGRPVESGSAAEPALVTPLRLTPRPELRADKAQVARAVEDGSAVLVNALPQELFEGGGDQVFGRRGRIKGSVSLPSGDLIDPETGLFRPVEEIRAAFARRGAEGRPVIPYCGGGIAASTLMFALALIGREDAALYDGSLLEWGADPEAPMETGPASDRGS